MHWEARRRQNVLDRRMATKAKQCPTEDRQKQGTTEECPRETYLPPAVSAVNTVVDKRIICQCQPVKEQYCAKIENRYTGTCTFTLQMVL
ncbi:hypothetical protein Q7C36_002441 [Tachysurus vachellii]|uniref:Uncharacterized protein n=1 Tax=Tachysurus vachellii TaxID=175792 RepID=A0AA88NXK3_TACVA|nr:hypothetical protein Q7C36_002441 [Tachysurus vachellii]